MKNFSALLALTVIFCCGVFHGARAEDANEDAAYLMLVDKAMKEPASVNWTELRTLYTETSFYKPYAGMVMWPEFDAAGKAAAMQGGADNLKKFQDLQREQYANFKSHIAAIKLASSMGPQRTSFINKALEQQALEGIADSIVASGNGSSPDKAFKVITSEEEDLIVGTYLGSAVRSHQEAAKDGHHFEVLYYANKDPKAKKDGVAIFNIDVQYAHEQAASAFPTINK